MSVVDKIRRNIGIILRELKPEQEERVAQYIILSLRKKGYSVKVYPLARGFEFHFTNPELEREIRVFEPDYILAHTEASGSVELSPFRFDGYYPLGKNLIGYWLARENALIAANRLLDIGCLYSYFHETKYSFHMHFSCPVQSLDALLRLIPITGARLEESKQLQYCYEP